MTGSDREMLPNEPTRAAGPGMLALLLGLGILVVAGCDAPASPSSTSQQTLQAEKMDDRVRVLVDGEMFTEYKYADDQKYPYFYPVVGPVSGESVTTESSEPWPHHHSLFFGCDKVNGGNYWQEGLERGQIVPTETVVEQSDGEAVVITQTNEWRRPDAESPFRDERRIRITAPSEELRVIDFEITLTPLTDVRIEQNNHSLFSARMVPELSVDSGGTLVNAHGRTGEDGTWGEPAPWADYWGSREEGTEGLAILNHPDNRWSPPKWFTRNYGFFSPTPMNWLEDGYLELSAGEDLHLRYRVLVHSGTTEDALVADRYAQYAEIK